MVGRWTREVLVSSQRPQASPTGQASASMEKREGQRPGVSLSWRASLGERQACPLCHSTDTQHGRALRTLGAQMGVNRCQALLKIHPFILSSCPACVLSVALQREGNWGLRRWNNVKIAQVMCVRAGSWSQAACVPRRADNPYVSSFSMVTSGHMQWEVRGPHLPGITKQ